MAEDSKPAQGTPLIEKAVGALGALLLLGLCGVLGWDAFYGDRSPPHFRFEVLGTEAQAGGRLVHLRVHNDGGTTVAELMVTGKVGEAEPVELTLDYVAAHGHEDGGMLFAGEPADGAVAFEAKSYREP